jgi:hypothetical protein
MANQAFEGKIVVVGAGAKNLGGLMSRTFGRLHSAPEGSMKYMALVAGSGRASYPPSSLREGRREGQVGAWRALAGPILPDADAKIVLGRAPSSAQCREPYDASSCGDGPGKPLS